MDNFKEQIVAKIPTSADRTAKTMTMIGGIVLGIAVVGFSFRFAPAFSFVSIVIGSAIVYGAFWLSLKYDVEYEYIFTNGEIDVDKIIAQRSRKRLVTLKLSKATAFGIADENYVVPEKNTLVLAGSGEEGTDEYYVEAEHRKLGTTTLIFSPDEQMLELVKNALPRNLKRD